MYRYLQDNYLSKDELLAALHEVGVLTGIRARHVGKCEAEWENMAAPRHLSASCLVRGHGGPLTTRPLEHDRGGSSFPPSMLSSYSFSQCTAREAPLGLDLGALPPPPAPFTFSLQRSLGGRVQRGQSPPCSPHHIDLDDPPPSTQAASWRPSSKRRIGMVMVASACRTLSAGGSRGGGGRSHQPAGLYQLVGAGGGTMSHVSLRD